MKKLLFFAALFCIAHSSWAGKVTLPGDLVLIKRLNDHGFGEYDKKTTIVSQLADKEDEVKDILDVINSTFKVYCASLNGQQPEEAEEVNKLFLVHALLVEHPQAYQEAINILGKQNSNN